MENELIDTYQKATERGFSGSPTVLVDGVDPFGDDGAAPVGMPDVSDRKRTSRLAFHPPATPGHGPAG